MRPTYLFLKNSHEYALPPHFQEDDVRYASTLVRHFVEAHTQPGDVILDPFAGYGTTLYVAEALGRQAYGLEFTADRAAFIRANLQRPENLIQGDARRLATYALPPIDFAMSSPPYMHPQDPENPLTAYQTTDGDYGRYLDDLRDIYRQLGQLLKPGGRVVIEAANLKHEDGVTPLAWHIAEQVAQVLHFEGEIVACWDYYGYGYDHSYCLVFSK